MKARDANDVLREDGADALRAGIDASTAFRKQANGNWKDKEPPELTARPYLWTDPTTVAPREFLSGRHLIRKFVSSTVAAGGVGKSTLLIAETLAQCTARPLLGSSVFHRPLRVWLWNLEDPADEITRRIQAGCLHYGIGAEEIEGRLFVNSGRDDPCVIAKMTREGAKIVVPVTENILAELQAKKIDVLIIDPFVSCHELPENDNTLIDMVVKAWARIADRANCAIDLVHHTRKLGDGEATAEASRGGKAMVDACRSVRIINRMTQAEAEKAAIKNHRLYFRAMTDKLNLAPPPDKSDWFRLESVDLGNGAPGYSDLVGVVVPWEWPSAFDGISPGDVLAVQKAIAAGHWKQNSQATDWAGVAVADTLGLDLDDAPVRPRVKQLLKTWIESGALKVERRQDDTRHERPFITVGTWITD